MVALAFLERFGMLNQLSPLSVINRRFGTWRGLVRASLAQAELVTGRLNDFKLQRPEQVERVVFVCLGNICRSAYAHHFALQSGLHAVSIGLRTTTGGRSPKPALEAARRAGINMDSHRATPLADFEVKSGDLLLVMEVRQAHELRRRIGSRTDVQICLLGLWCTPSMPHLHDPFTLSDLYFDSAFQRIGIAVQNLSKQVLAVQNKQTSRLRIQPRNEVAQYIDDAETAEVSHS